MLSDPNPIAPANTLAAVLDPNTRPKNEADTDLYPYRPKGASRLFTGESGAAVNDYAIATTAGGAYGCLLVAVIGARQMN